MGMEKELTTAIEKIKYFNTLYESIGLICLSISIDLLFNVSGAMWSLLPMWSRPHWKDYSARRMQ
jgi:hypothetical protein